MNAVKHVTPSSGNIFADLGLAGAADLKVRAQLAATILKTMREMGLTQTAAAARMGISQPKLSNMLRGRLTGISENKIIECLQALGHDVDIRVGKRHEGVGQVRVLEAA